MTNETQKYTVAIILSTTNGELPTDDEVEQLVLDQMSGELDETTGLACLAVVLLNKDTDIGDRSYIYKGIE
jgi:hypothetical protein